MCRYLAGRMMVDEFDFGELEHDAEQEDKRPNTGVFLHD